MPANTAAVPLIDYLVQTECGRNFGWSATDMSSLVRDLEYRGYKATFVQTMSEYEAELHAQEEQDRLVDELRKAAGQEMKRTA